MSVTRLFLSGIVLAGAGALFGCNEQSLPQAPNRGAAPGPAVAVVDVEAVARALGRDVVIREQLETAGKELNQQLRDMAQELKDQFDAERARLGADATQEEREQLARMGAEAQARVQQGQLAAQRKAQELQAQIARQFQDEVRPVAAQVAHERGAVVAIPTSFLLWADGGADITSAVIERMKSTQPPQ